MCPLIHLRRLCRTLWLGCGLLCAAASAQAYTLTPYHWDQPVVPIYFRFDPGSYQSAFSNAMETWNTVNPAVQLQTSIHTLPQLAVGIACAEGANAATFAYSVCGDPWKADVLAITLMQYNKGNGSAEHGVILFNANIPFTLYTGPVRANSYDFARVALHELGHFLGLDHETTVPAIMQPHYNNTENLTNDDRQGIKARYPH